MPPGTPSPRPQAGAPGRALATSAVVSELRIRSRIVGAGSTLLVLAGCGPAPAFPTPEALGEALFFDTVLSKQHLAQLRQVVGVAGAATAPRAKARAGRVERSALIMRALVDKVENQRQVQPSPLSP